jgi:hypothetical protein
MHELHGAETMNDKWLHAAAGALVALGALWIVSAAEALNIPAAMTLAGFVVGVGYEAVQAFRKEGTPDPLDALATLAGAVVLAGIYAWVTA